MKKIICSLVISGFFGVADAMPSYHVNPPVPSQHIHVHYDHFDRNTYIMGGVMLGLTIGVVIWALTDRYVDPTRFSVEF